MRIRTTLLSLLLLATFAGEAHADRWKVERFDKNRIRVNIMTGVGWYNDVGVGFRLEIPILANLVKGVPNDLRASVGGELRWFYHPKYDGFGGYPVAVGQWNFYLTDRWSFFPELGFCGVFAPERKRFWGGVHRALRGRWRTVHIQSARHRHRVSLELASGDPDRRGLLTDA